MLQVLVKQRMLINIKCIISADEYFMATCNTKRGDLLIK